MLLASKHFTPIVGIDIHIIIIPPGVPTPIPHPFVGIVMDPMDYVPKIGATVNVNYVPRGNSSTAGMLGIKFHIPLGGPFAVAPLVGHDASNFFGSTRVKAEGCYFTPAGYMVMTCNDIGAPLSLSPGKKMKPVPSCYLPSSNSIPVPMGKPVRVGGPYAPDLVGMVMGLVMSYGFGALMKVGGKLIKKGLTKLNHGVFKKFKATKGLSEKLCKKGFEPIDLVTGRMIYEGEDFSLPGPLTITWQRSWYSDSGYEGIMGHGMHNNYDVALHIEKEENLIIMRLPDGRITNFPFLIAENESAYNRTEKLTLTCIDSTTYKVKNHNTQETYVFNKRTNTLYKPSLLQNTEGFSIEFAYTSSHKLKQITDSIGRIIKLELDRNKRVTKITASHRGKTRTLVSYTYNEEGDMIAITDALNQATVMEYKNHLMVKKTDRNGQAFYWEYDGNTTGAKCIKTWGDDNILSGKLEYHNGYNIITNSLGEQSIYYFNEDNLCTQVTDPMGNSIFHEYTPYMEFYRDIDEEGNITGYSYDNRGNMTALHQPNGAVINFIYDDKDRLTLTKYPEGGSIIRTFKDNRLHAVIGLDEGVTSFDYNEEGLLNEVRDNKGNITQLFYDEDYNLNKMLLPNNTESHWQYDEWGRCLQTKNSENHKQRFYYDALDRIYRVQQADSNVINLKYNAYNEVIQTIDQRRREINFEYTPMGSLKMREQQGKKVHFQYNTEEQLQSITNEHNEYYRFARNAKGDIITEIGFDGLTRRYNRDRAGKVLRVNRPNDKYTEYEYDYNGKITRAEHSDGTWETYSYNRDGNLIEAINQNSEVHFIRDEAGRIIAEKQDEHTVESLYDALGNRIKISSSLGANINLKRNNFGQIKEMSATVTPTKNNTTPHEKVWSAQFAYNSIGMETERILPGGITNQMAYDYAGRPIAHKVTRNNKELRHRTYTWNVNDRLIKMVNQLTSGIVNYSYDAFNNLAEACYENHEFDYKLPDEVGNLYRTKTKTDRVYGKGGKLLKSKNNTYKYDAEGNLTTKATPKGDFKYQWYGNGMLKSVTRPDNKHIVFEYDALGRRTAKITHNRPPEPDSEVRKNNYKLRKHSSPSLKETPKKQTGIITRFIWNGNMPLHEWQYHLKDRPKTIVDELGMLTKDREEPLGFVTHPKTTQTDTEGIITQENKPPTKKRRSILDLDAPLIVSLTKNSQNKYSKHILEPKQNNTKNGELITWVFDEDTFKPAAKIVNGETYSIICDYLGTPVEMYNSKGEKTWEVEYDIYGKVRKLATGSLEDCPFRYQGQYEDVETGLYYNRFRYYSADEGVYISQDLLGLASGEHNFYCYVSDTNKLLDVFGLFHHNDTGHNVYALYDVVGVDDMGNNILADKPYYVGITNDLDTRRAAHKKSGRLTDNGTTVMEPLHRNITYGEARGYEQAYIEHYETKTGTVGEDISQKNRGNKINSFDVDNKTREKARQKSFSDNRKKKLNQLKGGCK